MVLYKTTKEGRIPMTKEEEDSIRADWAEADNDPGPPKTLDERVAELEKAVAKLNKK